MKPSPAFAARARLRATVLMVLVSWGLAVFGGQALAKENLADKPLKVIPDALIDPGGDKNIIVVEKTTQTLGVYQYKNGLYFLWKSLPCTTGENVGDKRTEGDKKTPEGFYLFNKKAVESELAPIYGVMAYPMDYPNFWDQINGKGGSGIWMHGLNRPRLSLDTNGCVALENIDLINLEDFIQLNETPIFVYDKIRFKNVSELKEEAAKIKAFIESWRQAWAGKDFKAYRAFYAKDFKSNDGKDYQAWMAHKERLKQHYTKIKVELNHLHIYRHQDIIVTIFSQDYRGNETFVSQGIKRLYLRDKNGRFEITAEEFNHFPPPPSPKTLPMEVKQRVLAEAEKAAQAKAAEPSVKVAAATSVKSNGEPPAKVATPTTVKSNGEPPAKAATVTAAKAAEPSLAKTKPAEKPEPKPSDEERVKQTISDWLNAWRASDLDRYLSHYHPNFRFKGKDLADYRKYKSGLMEKYGRVIINIKDLNVRLDGEKAKVTFVQDFRAEQYRDQGLKTMVLLKNQQKWSIKEESWQDMSAGAKP